MKKLIIAVMLLGASFMTLGSSASANSTHVVEKGDTLWKISVANGVSVTKLMSMNNLSSYMIYPGQKITLPATAVTQAEIDLMARLVHAEAKGESYAGKVAVATVVLNRVAHKDFPNTIREVIYQKSNGYYAFSPVANGQINQPASAESYKAVKEALAFSGQGRGSVFFYNPDKITNKWILSREVTVRIGNHVFAK